MKKISREEDAMKPNRIRFGRSPLVFEIRTAVSSFSTILRSSCQERVENEETTVKYFEWASCLYVRYLKKKLPVQRRK